MRFLSMFSGIDAASVAWGPLGWKAAAFCEIEAFPSAVLAHHYPDTPNLGDVTKADFDAIGPIDLAVFGSPCQSFSVAGLRLGLDDARGNLALIAGRIVYRKRPRWFVFENVPGLLSSDGGSDFGTLLAAFAGYPSGSVFQPPADGWGNAGVVVQANGDSYGLAWRVLDAQYFGVAQRRRRVFVVGYLGDWRRAAAVLFERHSLSGHPAPRREAGQRVAALTSSGVGTCGADDNQGQAGHLIPSTGETAHCLNAGGMGRQDYETETLIAHTLKGEGFDASEDGTGRGTPIVPVAYRTTGNDGAYETGDQVGALTTSTDPTAQIIAFSAKDHGADAMSDLSPTLRAGGHNTSHANAGVMPAVAYGITRDALDRSGEGAGQTPGERSGLGIIEEQAQTLKAAGPGAVAFVLRGREGGAMPEVEGDGERIGALRAGSGGSSRDYVATSAVRRLTPRECERLQGFPDDWTLIPTWAKGAPKADAEETARWILQGDAAWRFGTPEEKSAAWERGLKMARHPDGPRYKALGNSMAVPVMAWIGRRIAAVDALLIQSERTAA